MSYLNGEILSQLPQLHSLQLAGTNPWSCDCRLRKLARQLARHSTGKDALNRASIIQDEPRCLLQPPSAGGGGGGSRTKTANGLQAQEPDSNNNSGVSHSSSTVVVAAVGSPDPSRQQQRQMERKAEEDSRWSRDSWTNMSKYNQWRRRLAERGGADFCRLQKQRAPHLSLCCRLLVILLLRRDSTARPDFSARGCVRVAGVINGAPKLLEREAPPRPVRRSSLAGSLAVLAFRRISVCSAGSSKRQIRPQESSRRGQPARRYCCFRHCRRRNHK